MQLFLTPSTGPLPPHSTCYFDGVIFSSVRVSVHSVTCLKVIQHPRFVAGPHPYAFAVDLSNFVVPAYALFFRVYKTALSCIYLHFPVLFRSRGLCTIFDTPYAYSFIYLLRVCTVEYISPFLLSHDSYYVSSKRLRQCSSTGCSRLHKKRWRLSWGSSSLPARERFHKIRFT